MMIRNRILPALLLLTFATTLISWGVTGHRTIGRIAESHLNPQARAAVTDLLEGSSLADVSTYADEIRPKPEYKYTAPWHYINLPRGLNSAEFASSVNSFPNDNIHSALQNMMRDLADPKSSRQKKVFALKFIVHLVGDLHQPMHVGRAEDKGGNDIQLNFMGKGTNMHSLWDSRLLQHLGLSDTALALQYNRLTPKKVKKLQKDPLMKWLYESYQAGSLLYAEVDGMSNRSIGQAYYLKHIPTVETRIQYGAIRLAGVLNQIFSGQPMQGNIIAPPAVQKR